MERQLQMEFEGAIHRVISRSCRKDSVFEDDEVRLDFLRTVGETCELADWEVHAYFLMETHFHLVLETARLTQVTGIGWFLGADTKRFNAGQGMRGRLSMGSRGGALKRSQ